MGGKREQVTDAGGGGGGGCLSQPPNRGQFLENRHRCISNPYISVDPTFGLKKKRVSLTEFIHMSMEKQNLDLKMYMCEVSGYKFHSVLY